MRFGTLTQASIIKFGKLKRQPKYDDGIEPTELCVGSPLPKEIRLIASLYRFPLRNQVDSANKTRLDNLPGEAMVFNAIDEGEEPHDKMIKTLENVMAPRTLTLKIDAQVMMLKNMDCGLVNGSVGKVVGFKASDEVDEDDDLFIDDQGFRAGLNAKLAQFKAAAAREGSAGPSRQGSREPSAAPSEGGEGKGKGPAGKNQSTGEKVPIVAWKMPDGSILKMRMQREEFKVEDNGDKVKARRRQVHCVRMTWLGRPEADASFLLAVPDDLCLGHEHPQVSRSDTGASQMRSGQNLRERPSLRSSVSLDDVLGREVTPTDEPYLSSVDHEPPRSTGCKFSISGPKRSWHTQRLSLGPRRSLRSRDYSPRMVAILEEFPLPFEIQPSSMILHFRLLPELAELCSMSA